MDKNKEQPKVSIITVVFNSVKTIEQTIFSVLSQTYSNIEYIIIDGGSTDGTVDIIKRYEDKLGYWISEPDKGIYDAMNKGIRVANGDWLYIIGADDCLVHENIFMDISKFFEEEIDVLSGLVWAVDDESGMQHLSGNNFGRTIDEDVQSGDIESHHQGIFVRSHIMKHLYFDTQYRVGADYKLLLQIWLEKKYKKKKIENIIAFFSTNGIGSNEVIRNAEHIQILEEMNFSKEKIKQILDGNKNKLIKLYLKKILVKLRMWKYLRRYNGWMLHKCSWKACRWCK